MKTSPAIFRKRSFRLRRGLLAGVWLLPLMLADRGFALDPARSLQEYNLRTWSRQNGLPANSITAITQTRDGYLWLGTSAGLVRFDGIEFKLLDLSSVTNLSGSTVTSLANARNGGLWVGLKNSSFGFCDGRSFSFLGRPAWGGLDMNVRSLAESEDGTLWFAAENGAARLTRSETFEQLMTPGLPARGTQADSPTNGTLDALCSYEDRQGRLWFGTPSRGLYYWQTGKLTQVADPALDATLILSIAEDHEGQIWVGTADGLRCIDSNLRPKATLPLDAEVRALLVDDHDVLWIGTFGRGLGRYRDGACEFFQKADGLGSDYVNALAEDHEGSLWIGTRGGVSQLTDVKFPTVPAAKNPSVKDANAVCASHQGGVWIGSPRGVTYFDPASGTRETYGSETGIPSRYIKRVFEASDGDLYLVCYMKTLAILSPERKLLAVHTNSDLVVGMAEDAHGVVVSVAGELYRAGTNYFQPYAFTNAEKPPMYWILNLASGRDGVIWVASAGGIFRVKDGAYQQWSATEGLSAPVLGICEDNEGVVWGATLRGIVRLKDNRISIIDRQHGLADDNIYAVVPDDLGNLWVDSGRGIFSVSRQSVNDFADGKTARVQCTMFDGMNSVKLSDKTPQQERVACKTADGRIWFPSANGVVMLDPAHIPVNRVAPQVHIDLVKADGDSVIKSSVHSPQSGAAGWRPGTVDSGLRTVIVPPGKGELEFHFDALTFIAPQKVQFRYRLEGYDPDWVDAGDRHMAFYTNLKPGQYAFRVIAANADGVWSERGDALNIELRPHYYQSAWFRLLCGGLALAALMGVYRWRVKHLEIKHGELQKKRDLLEAEIRNRTAELADSRNFLDRIINAISDPIFVKDRQHRGVLVNDAFCKLMARRREELIGKSDHDHASLRGGQADEFRSKDEWVFETGRENVNDEKLTAADGTVHYIITKKALYTDEKGEQFIVGVIQDITERQRAEELLRESQALYHSLVDQMPAAVFRKDAEGRYVFVNSSFCQVIGMPAEQILGKTVPDLLACMKETQSTKRLVSDKLGTQGLGHHESIMRTGRHIAVEDEYLGSDGRRSYYHTVKSPVFDADGTIVGSQGILFNITDRKLAEEALQESQALFLSLVDQMPAGVFRRDKQGRFVFVNAWFCKVKGMNPDQILGRTAPEIAAMEQQNPTPKWLPEFASQGHAHHEQIMRTGQTIEVEEQYAGTDGKTQQLRVVKSPVFDSDGRIVGTQGMLFDITAAKEAEAALSYERDLLRTLLDNSPDQIYFKDAQSRFIKTSQAQAVLFGLKSADELAGKTDFDFFTEEHARPAFEDEQEIIRTGRPLIGKVEKEIMKDGRVSWALTNKMPLRNKDGQIIGTFGISKNITDLKQAQEAAAYERDLLRTLLDNSPDSIFFKDLQSRLVNVSRSEAANLFRIALSRHHAAHPGEGADKLPAHLASVERFHEYVIGKTDADTYGDERAGAFNQDEREIIRTGRPMIGKIEETACPDGSSIWHMTTKVPWRNKDGEIIGTFGTSKDISDLKSAEAKIEETHKQLLETSRQAGMAEIATNVLHNIGNVLNSVNVSASLVVDSVKHSKAANLARVAALLREHEHDLGTFITADAKGRQLPGYLGQLAEQLLADQTVTVRELDLLVKNIEHIKEVVAMQQNYARVSGVTEIINVRELVEDSLRMNAGALARHRVEVVREFEDVPPLNTDKHRVLQILVNLIRNAKYACDESGREDRQMTVRVANGEGRIKISVSDNGVGIPPENLTRIFSHGFTTRQGGHGFGLHSGALAARELGGSLTAHSDGPDRGAVFELQLPAAPESIKKPQMNMDNK